MADFLQKTLKIQVFGHSFVTRLRNFIKYNADVNYSLNLRQSDYMIQYSGFPGASVETLLAKLEVVSDFHPDVVFLLIGTNDLYSQTAADTANKIIKLVNILETDLKIRYVCVGQITPRAEPKQPTRYPVNIETFNNKVHMLNKLLYDRLHGQQSACLWRMRGFWSSTNIPLVIHRDGVHLTDLGNKKLLTSIRAAIVSIQKAAFQ